MGANFLDRATQDGYGTARVSKRRIHRSAACLRARYRTGVPMFRVLILSDGNMAKLMAAGSDHLRAAFLAPCFTVAAVLTGWPASDSPGISSLK